MRRLTYPVSPAQEGQRLETVLRHYGVSGSVIRRAKRLETGLLLDDSPAFSTALVHGGQTVSVLVDDVKPSQIPPVDGPLSILYEDGDLLIIDKAPGVTVHPGPGHWGDSLGNYVMGYYRKIGLAADFHPVHRLDKGTSGVLVVAKHPAAQHALTAALHSGDFYREYRAVCEGVPSPLAGVIDAPLGPSDASRIRQEVRPDGKPARTRYETLKTAGPYSLLKLVLDTGRTHQIRAHMAHLGHPLVGDFLYGKEDRALITRPALHSARLELTQPFTGEKLCFEVPLPEDMARLMGL